MLLMFSSCLDDAESTGQMACVVTIENTTNQVILHMDGGLATIYPTMESVNSVGSDLFKVYKRAYVYFSYPEDRVSEENGKSVFRDVTLEGFQAVSVLDMLTKTQAEEKNLLETDSISTINNVLSAYVDNGYLTYYYNTYYMIRDGKGILPSLNLVMEQDEDNFLSWNGTLLLNMHKTGDYTKESQSSYTIELFNSFDLTPLRSQYPPSGLDSITINVKTQGKSDVKFRVAIDDLSHRN